jgi:hypothetical protein
LAVDDELDPGQTHVVVSALVGRVRKDVDAAVRAPRLGHGDILRRAGC